MIDGYGIPAWDTHSSRDPVLYHFRLFDDVSPYYALLDKTGDILSQRSIKPIYDLETGLEITELYICTEH